MKLTTFSYLIFFCLITSFSLDAQDKQRAIAILDLTENNGDTNDARMLSVEHMARVAGIPFVITPEVEEATGYAMILSSSLYDNSTFTLDEKALLQDYVEEGGLLIAPRVQDVEMYELFGIDTYVNSKTRFEIHWDSTLTDASLRYIDEPEERIISLGRSTYDEIYKTVAYSTTTASTLAFYEDGSPAIIKNAHGEGYAITIGVSWKEVILRNQINRDYEAQRITSNGFEPTTDVLVLFVRALFMEHVPHTVWKNTSPGKSMTTLMVSHDIDSSTGMDTLPFFVDYESANGIRATYNITVRYIDDELMTPFYLDRQATLDYIQDNGQHFGSHSVGHFFDFADEDIFPVGTTGNTTNSYLPFNDGVVTTGGTVYGECEVSKNVLEEDIDGLTIRTFRAGHLAYPKYLIDVLDDLGYAYNSTYSASDVLNNFPYQNKKGRSFSGERSSVYEIPVTISDVFHDDPISADNVFDKADIWLKITERNRANGAPVVLLIHPNRTYKLDGMAYYLDELPGDIKIMEMEEFGDYWRAREDFEFNSELDDDQLNITIPNTVDLGYDISFIVDAGQNLASINVVNESGEALDFSQDDWGDDDVIIYSTEFAVGSNPIATAVTESNLKVSPNPVSDHLTIAFEVAVVGNVQIDMYDLYGTKVRNLFDGFVSMGDHLLDADLSEGSLSNGIYFIVMSNSAGVLERVKVVVL